MIQDLSFALRYPKLQFGELTFGVFVYTSENGYGLSEAHLTVDRTEESLRATATALTWANEQELGEGGATVLVRQNEGGGPIVISLAASARRAVRSVKLLLCDMPTGEIANLRETSSRAIPAGGLALHYPEGWRNLQTPIAVVRTSDGRYTYFRSLDAQVRDKRFVFLPNADGKTMNVELIFEEDAVRGATSVDVPDWEIGVCDTLEEILARHASDTESGLKLTAWEQRSDVPEWMREISLVAAIHMQHWNGYIFNDYEKTGDTIEWLARQMEPKRILAYLPGWEGRYYWQYGDYRPDPRMGGEEGFRRLLARAKKLGIRVMPMFGMNFANRGMENFEQWGQQSLAHTAGGFPITGSVDWDGSRHYDHGHGAFLNPGAPGWQNRLVGQIRDLAERYGFDGAFLDISTAWVNDPSFHYYEGLRELCRRIREDRPEFLIAGEGWYDAAGLATPLMQCGHTDGVMHWHDEPYAPAFEKYNRQFGHLCLGAPGKGSTGVHEHGFNPRYTRAPLRRSIIPTLTIVDDTLAAASEEAIEIIADAKEYARLYL